MTNTNMQNLLDNDKYFVQNDKYLVIEPNLTDKYFEQVISHNELLETMITLQILKHRLIVLEFYFAILVRLQSVMNIEKFEIMQSIQNALDNLTADEPRNNRVYDELIRLRNKIHNADRLESKFHPNAYMIKNLRTKKNRN